MMHSVGLLYYLVFLCCNKGDLACRPLSSPVFRRESHHEKNFILKWRLVYDYAIVRNICSTRFSALDGSLFFSSESSWKPKRTQTATEVVAVWVRFGFQLGLRQWEALIIMHSDYGTNWGAKKSDPPNAEKRVVRVFIVFQKTPKRTTSQNYISGLGYLHLKGEGRKKKTRLFRRVPT